MSSPADSSARYDLIVLGAGAAGLLGAARAAERDKRVLLVEKNRKAGVKILISGGTRCNLTQDCDRAGIMAAFGSAGPFLHSPLAALGPRELVELFHAEGLDTYVEPGGKIFPASDRALDVVQVLVNRLRRSGAELALDEAVVNLRRHETGFEVVTAKRTLRAAKVLVTVGGKSYPGCGTTGDGYAWLAALGHTIRPPRPALVPLLSEEQWVRDLAGITLDVRLRVIDPAFVREGEAPAEPSSEPRVDPSNSTPIPPRLSGSFALPAKRTKQRRPGQLPPGVLIERRGALLFTHFGLSGPVALDVSRAVTKHSPPHLPPVEVDFLPDVSAAALEEQLRAAALTDGKKLVVNLLPDLLPRRLFDSLYALAGLAPERRAAEWSKAEQARLVAAIKSARIAISGDRGYPKAEVTAGGVALDEVDSRTMQSKLVPNLYLAGEILDLDGFIGGYNFQAAFSTAWLAGESV